MTSQMIDWDLASTLGSRVAGSGPPVTADEAIEAVEELRAGAEKSSPLVREFTGLHAEDRTAPVLIVDRAGWVKANCEGFATMLDPIVTKLTAKKPPSGPVSQAVGARVTGSEVGLLLGFLGTKVLGQFDPFFDPAGRLLLVAPNVVNVERELDADPTDFRLWVCLHEETHRVQFTAVPWMREHLFSEIQAIADVMDPSSVLDGGIEKLAQVMRGEGGSLLDVIGGPEQRVIVDRITGVMSLLEGHADVVMDGVGPSVIPSVAEIRRKFNQRRKGVGALDKLLRRLLGLEAKMAQYRDGAVFVRAVIDQVGMDGFNAIWVDAANLPSKQEIAEPRAWVSRVHG